MSRISHLPIKGEVWKPVPGFNDHYEASSEGRIRCIKKGGRTRILTLQPSAYGYMYAQVYHDGKRRNRGIHQLVALAFIGPCPTGMEVNHVDLDKLNNRPRNLEYLTHAKNLQHARSLKSWSAKGEASGKAKLTEEEVRAIRRDSRSQRAIAAEYGITQVSVCLIRQRKSWKHVED